MHALNLPPPLWVATPLALRRMIDDLNRRTLVAIDTESNGMHAYQEQVCLIQFSTGEVDYLVDPLALADLSALAPLFANASIQKIFHAAEYDLLCLKRDFGYRITNLFDTMQASRILGKKELGLGAILESMYGVHMDKRYQRSNWARRPLPDVMQLYARLDSHYLIDLRNHLMAELAERGLLSLAQEDFHRLENTPAAPLEIDPPTCWKVAGKHNLTPTEAAILQQLCNFRDQQARYANLPPFRILPDHVLAELAQAAPHTLDELIEVHGLTTQAFERYGIGLLDAISQGLEARPLYPPRNQTRPNNAFLRRNEALRKWRKEVGQEMGVESDVVLPRDALDALVQANPRSSHDVAEVMRDYPWRLDRFGEQILKVLQQKGKTT